MFEQTTLGAHTRCLTNSRGILGIPHLARLLGVRDIRLSLPDRHRDADVYLGWGRKGKSENMRSLATRREKPFVALEDGFIRSSKPGLTGKRPYSIIVDPVGVYYDAAHPSLLENWLNGSSEHEWLSPDRLQRAQTIRGRIVASHISKYNFVPDISLPPADRPRILLADQTYGDAAIHHGLADAGTFSTMLEAAMQEHPDAEILIKTHPDVLTGRKHGHFFNLPDDPRITLITEPCTPQSLIAVVDHVYVVTSQLGFEALLAQKPVTCFGAPFYSNWGLTDDRVRLDRRKNNRTLDELVAAALIAYPRYIHPETDTPCEVEDLLGHFELQRAWYRRTAGTYHCFGITPWKRNTVRRFLQSPNATVVFHRSASTHRIEVGRDDHLLTWGMRRDEEVEAIARHFGRPAGRIEDGFIRSVGLGTDYNQPLSLVFDRCGIYFDASRPSELEGLLETSEFSEQELQRAASLRKQIIENRISKYNLVESVPELPTESDRTVILVPGQVPSDASIQAATRDIRTNLDLLAAVRKSTPGAYIVFKPHPDVVSGNRIEETAETRFRELCDHYAPRAPIHACLDVCDEVHTMTSLAGFEGLLRNKNVVTYGYPFYAGWGLTTDHMQSHRRTRELTLDELVAGVLIRYPRYISPNTGEYAHPEDIVSHISRLMGRPLREKRWGLVGKTKNLLRAFR
jgi:capsular polysaccharide export protein